MSCHVTQCNAMQCHVLSWKGMECNVCGMHVCMHVGSFVNVHVMGWNGMERDGMK